MAPRRDVRHAAWRTAPAVACGRRAWRRTRHLATKAARQSRGQTFLQACAALEPGTAQDRHRSVTQLSGGKSGDPGTGEREARVRQSGRPAEQPRREQPPTDARTRASHARLSRPETHTEASGRSGNTSRSSGICCALHSIANSSRRDSLPGANSPKSPKIRPTRSEGRFFLPSFRLSLDKLTEPLGRLRAKFQHDVFILRISCQHRTSSCIYGSLRRFEPNSTWGDLSWMKSSRHHDKSHGSASRPTPYRLSAAVPVDPSPHS